MKSRPSLPILLSLLLATWSASTRAADSAPPAAAPPAGSEVVVWHGYRASERTALEKAVAAYNAAHPGAPATAVVSARPFPPLRVRASDRVADGLLAPAWLLRVLYRCSSS